MSSFSWGKPLKLRELSICRPTSKSANGSTALSLQVSPESLWAILFVRSRSVCRVAAQYYFLVSLISLLTEVDVRVLELVIWRIMDSDQFHFFV